MFIFSNKKKKKKNTAKYVQYKKMQNIRVVAVYYDDDCHVL